MQQWGKFFGCCLNVFQRAYREQLHLLLYKLTWKCKIALLFRVTLVNNEI